MLELAIIADDITGAGDTGVQFLPVAAPVYLIDHRALGSALPVPPPQAICVHTDSRGLGPAQAGRRVLAAGRAVGALRPRRAYKKIDSGLRGPIGAEIEALMDALAIELSFIAPAFIEQGRTTTGGIHRIHGVPVAESEMGRDPVSPVRDSVLPRWIEAQSRRRVAHIGLDLLAGGVEVLAEAVRRELRQGARHLTFDAAEIQHLDRIARLAADFFPQALLCGSAGLARSMAKTISGERAPMPPLAARTALPAGQNFFYACGSASEQLRAQMEELSARFEIPVVTVPPDVLLEPGRRSELAAITDRAAADLARGALVFGLPPRSAGRGGIDARQLLKRFAAAARRIIAAARPTGVFLSGGDTAAAVISGLGASAVSLECEIGSGLVQGRLVGGMMPGRPVVTKAGAFGAADALARLQAAIIDGSVA